MQSFYLFFLLFTSNLILASVPADGMISKNCSITPQIKNLEYAPEFFNTTNNLRKNPGSLETATGKKIEIFGRLLDKNCVPISDAKIQIWQANHYGLYQYNTPISKNNYIKSKDFFDPNFVGSGTTFTNNLGQFNFLSIMPGDYEDNKPHININISHPDFDDFQTEMFFSDVIGNMNDINLKKIPANERYKLISVSKSNGLFHQNEEKNQEDFNGVYLFDIIIDVEITNKQY